MRTVWEAWRLAAVAAGGSDPQPDTQYVKEE